MPKNILSRARYRALTKQHKIAVAGVAALGTAAIALSAIPGNAGTVTTGSPATAAQVAKLATQDAPLTGANGQLTDRAGMQNVKLDTITAQKKAADQLAAKKNAADAAAKKAAQDRAAQQAANRSKQRSQVQTVAAKTYANNLDGWIRHSLDIMHTKGIPGSYNGLHRNIIRESSGNPMAINNWDINARNGIPSKGLLQVIDPTFKTYHVPGTSWNIYDPVANITAAANYAAHRYGSMDNVNSAY